MTTTHTIDVEAERETIGADKTFQNLLDEVGAAACDAWACGRDFGTAGKLADAESALIAHIDARLAAKRSIQPTIAAEDVRAPVLAAVGVEAQGNAIRPSAEPAGQLDANSAATFNEDRFRQLVLDVSNSSYILGRHTDEDEKYAQLMEVAERADSALIEYVLPFAMPEALEQSSTAGAAAGGNTIPEVPAAQPAADHAKRGGCCNNNCNQGRECPERK